VSVFVLVVVSASVIVAPLDEVNLFADGDHFDVCSVVTEARNDVADPRLEPLRPVDEQIRLEDVPLDVRTGFPAVTVLADRYERFGSRGVTRDMCREVAEHEERRLGFRFAST